MCPSNGTPRPAQLRRERWGWLELGPYQLASAGSAVVVQPSNLEARPGPSRKWDAGPGEAAPAARRGRGGVRVCSSRRSWTRTWVRVRACRTTAGRREARRFGLFSPCPGYFCRRCAALCSLGARRRVGIKGLPMRGRTQSGSPNAREPRASIPGIAVPPVGSLALRAFAEALRCPGTVAP